MLFKKSSKIFQILLGMALSILVLSACATAVETPTQGPDINAIYTQAAQTASALMTQIAQSTATLPPTPLPTWTSVPATNTSVPTDAPTQALPTNTPLPSATSVPTATPIPCNQAQFVKDVNVPDDTIFTPGADFTKTWRLKNIGSCTWTTGYDLVFASGERMDAARSVELTSSVAPGEFVDLSVGLSAPDEAGTYRGYWMLRDAQDKTFGIGAKADGVFWVQIKVVKANADYIYDFVANMCVAEWESGAGELPCPSADGDEDGYMYLLSKPIMEDGSLENEPAILVAPEQVKNGWIEARFPAMRIRDGYRFKSGVSCAADADGCNLVFSLHYQIGNGPLKLLGSWREVYDERFTPIDIDLTSLTGQDVSFIFSVQVEGNPKNAVGMWWVPHLDK